MLFYNFVSTILHRDRNSMSRNRVWCVRLSRSRDYTCRFEYIVQVQLTVLHRMRFNLLFEIECSLSEIFTFSMSKFDKII